MGYSSILFLFPIWLSYSSPISDTTLSSLQRTNYCNESFAIANGSLPVELGLMNRIGNGNFTKHQ